MELESLTIAAHSGYKSQKVARITRNAYLNFLREYKKLFCGLSPRDMVRYGARQWNKLKPEEKECFRKRNLLRSPPRLLYFTKIQNMKKRLSRKYTEPLECHTPQALGSAIAYIHFLRQFERKSRPLAAKTFRQRAQREWCLMTDGERNQFEEPLWYIQKG